MLRHLLVSAAILIVSAGPVPGQEPGDDEIAKSVEGLGSAEYAEREQAEQSLLLAGERALPRLEEAAVSGDPEVSFRASELLKFLRWGLSRDLVWRVGRELEGFDDAKGPGRVALVDRAVQQVGRDALPFLRAVVLREEDPQVVSRAIRSALEIADSGLESWLVGRVDGGGAPPVIYEALAERAAQGAIPHEVVLRFTRFLLDGPGKFQAPGVYPVWFSVLFEARRPDLVRELLRAGGFEVLAADSGCAFRVVRMLILRHERDLAWDLTTLVLDRDPGVDDAGVLARAFMHSGEIERAVELAERMVPPDTPLLAELYREALDADKELGLKREDFRQTCEAAPDEPQAWVNELHILVRALLYYGEGEEALELCKENEDLLLPRSSTALFLGAAVAAGKIEIAREWAGKIDRSSSDKPDWDLEFALEVADRWADREGPVRRDARDEFRGTIKAAENAERESRAGDALLWYAGVSHSYMDLPISLREEIERRIAYLVRVPGAVEEALRLVDRTNEEAWADLDEETRKFLEDSEREWNRALAEMEQIVGPFARELEVARRISSKAWIRHVAGDSAGAAREMEPLLAARPSPEERLDAAWYLCSAGSSERALLVLAPLLDPARWPDEGALPEPGQPPAKEELFHSPSEVELRVAHSLGALAERARGDTKLADGHLRALSEGESATIAVAAAYLAARGIDGAALREVERLGAPALDRNGPWDGYRNSPWDVQAYLLARRGDLDGAARSLAHSLTRERDSRHGRTERVRRVRVFEWRGRAALARGDREKAVAALRRAVGLDPLRWEVALLLAELLRDAEPERAARFARLAAEELRRRATEAPLDPGVPAGLARVLTILGRDEEARNAARRSEELAGEGAPRPSLQVETDPGLPQEQRDGGNE